MKGMEHIVGLKWRGLKKCSAEGVAAGDGGVSLPWFPLPEEERKRTQREERERRERKKEVLVRVAS